MPEALVVGCRETTGGGFDPSAIPRLRALASGCDAVLLGPGMMDDEAVAAVTLALLTEVRGPTFVLDASAFTGMRKHGNVLQRQGGRVVVTPHSGEMAKFLNITRDEVEGDPIGAARKAAAVVGGVVALKGKATHIVDPSDQLWLCEHGCIGLATSGSGDTLAGILAGLLARGAHRPSPRPGACTSTRRRGSDWRRKTAPSASWRERYPVKFPASWKIFGKGTGAVVMPNKPARIEIVEEKEGHFVLTTFADGTIERSPVDPKSKPNAADSGLCRKLGRSA